MDPAKMKVVDLRTELLKHGEDKSGLEAVLPRSIRFSYLSFIVYPPWLTLVPFQLLLLYLFLCSSGG